MTEEQIVAKVSLLLASAINRLPRTDKEGNTVDPRTGKEYTGVFCDVTHSYVVNACPELKELKVPLDSEYAKLKNAAMAKFDAKSWKDLPDAVKAKLDAEKERIFAPYYRIMNSAFDAIKVQGYDKTIAKEGYRNQKDPVTGKVEKRWANGSSRYFRPGEKKQSGGLDPEILKAMLADIA